MSTALRRALGAVGAAVTAGVLTACGQAPTVALMQTSITLPPPPPAAPLVPAEPLVIGDAAVDTTGGWLPDGRRLSAIDDAANPILAQLDPELLRAVQEATRAAAAEGVAIEVTSGWRSPGFQQRLFDDAVRTYGSREKAAELVATPEVSKHVTGNAVDIGPEAADHWLIANGPRFGLCQIYANEIWHFELVPGPCPPLLPNAAG